MALKIQENNSAVAHHIVDGPVLFPYAIDAHSAISRFPGEWSPEPWSFEDAAAARQELGHPEIEITPEEQALIDEHAKAVAEAAERLAAYRAKKAEEQAEADQVARDEALVASAPPRPEPPRKPLSPAQIRKRAAETDEERIAREDNERIVREKADADRLANASVTET